MQKSPFFISLFTVLFVFQISHAQNIDSLLIKLSEANLKKNTEEQFKLHKLVAGYYHSKRNYDKAIIHYDKALSVCSIKKEELLLYKKIGNVYVDSTNYKMALQYLNKAVTLSQKQKLTEEFPNIYNLIGMSYGLSNDLDMAVINFEKALEYNEVLNDSGGIALSYYNIGLAYYFKGSYDQAIEHFVISANIREKIGEISQMVVSLTSIGEIFRVKGEYVKSDIYYNEAVKYKDYIESKESKAYLYSELALVNKNRKKYEASLAYIDTAMSYCVEIGYKRGISTLKSYKADIAKELGNKEGALAYYLETIGAYSEINFEQGVVQSSIAIAQLYYEDKLFNKSLHLLKEIEPKARQNNLLEELNQIAELKFLNHKSLGNSKVALQELEDYIVLKDSLFNIQKEEKISEIETKFQTDKKEKQIKLLDQENQIKQQQINARNFLLIASTVGILLIIISFVLFFKRKKLQGELEIEQNRNRMLRSQMNPHFIYNALSAIQNFILQNNPIDSVTYISEFSALMRLVLEGSRNDWVNLQDDMKLVSSYLKLQKLRFDNKFDFEITVDENLNPEQVLVPPLLSQPFIENAVEHGMRVLPAGQGKIFIGYKAENDRLIIQINDNGPGIDNRKSQEIKKHKSLATTITKERIENIRKTHKINIEFHLVSGENSGTKITFVIPQKKQIKI